MEKRLPEQPFARPEFAPSYALDLLRDVGPVEIGAVHQLAGCDLAQQFGLVLGPDQDVAFVGVAHRDLYPTTMPSDALLEPGIHMPRFQDGAAIHIFGAYLAARHQISFRVVKGALTQ